MDEVSAVEILQTKVRNKVKVSPYLVSFHFSQFFVDLIFILLENTGLVRGQCPNLMNSSRVSNPTKTGFN